MSIVRTGLASELRLPQSEGLRQTMTITEMRRLDAKWQTGNGWPKWLEWIEITGVRGWTGQRISFAFPIVVLSRHAKELFVRCSIIPYGAANLGVALGQMVQARRFRRPTRVFLDGDQGEAVGCIVLPGGDAPERVVFNSLKNHSYRNLWTRIGRDISGVTDACNSAMTLTDHHEWVRMAANQLMCGGEALWSAMCAEWAEIIPLSEVRYITESIADALI
jgi:hypothetical protein